MGCNGKPFARCQHSGVKTKFVGPEDYTWTQNYLQYRRWKEWAKSGQARKDIEGSGSYPKRGTAPYEAASARHHEIFSLLISNWINIDEEDYEGRTSLYWAAFYLWSYRNREADVR